MFRLNGAKLVRVFPLFLNPFSKFGATIFHVLRMYLSANIVKKKIRPVRTGYGRPVRVGPPSQYKSPRFCLKRPLPAPWFQSPPSSSCSGQDSISHTRGPSQCFMWSPNQPLLAGQTITELAGGEDCPSKDLHAPVALQCRGMLAVSLV